MKMITIKLSKHSLLSACVFASFCAVSFNVLFNYFVSQVLSLDVTHFINNTIDTLQLVVYILVKMSTFGKLGRYDLPFIISGILSIML